MGRKKIYDTWKNSYPVSISHRSCVPWEAAISTKLSGKWPLRCAQFLVDQWFRFDCQWFFVAKGARVIREDYWKIPSTCWRSRGVDPLVEHGFVFRRKDSWTKRTEYNINWEPYCQEVDYEDWLRWLRHDDKRSRKSRKEGHIQQLEAEGWKFRVTPEDIKAAGELIPEALKRRVHGRQR